MKYQPICVLFFVFVISISKPTINRGKLIFRRNLDCIVTYVFQSYCYSFFLDCSWNKQEGSFEERLLDILGNSPRTGQCETIHASPRCCLSGFCELTWKRCFAWLGLNKLDFIWTIFLTAICIKFTLHNHSRIHVSDLDFRFLILSLKFHSVNSVEV